MALAPAQHDLSPPPFLGPGKKNFCEQVVPSSRGYPRPDQVLRILMERELGQEKR